jgi:hypothetical protein
MIQIHLFNSSQNQYRIPLVKAALTELANIKQQNRDKIHLVVCCNVSNESTFNEILMTVVEAGIEVSLALLESDEYVHKMNIAQQTQTEYICKWDDDVFINRHVWDFMIENVDNVLNNPNVSVLAPTLSNGMSSIELFIKDFLTDPEKELVSKMFIRDNIDPNIFGCNYQSAYDYITKLDSWDGDRYWEMIQSLNPTIDRNVPWFYSIVKGVHPGRFSYDYNMFIANHAIRNKNLILDKREYYLEQYITPYFCNNLFIAKTQFYLDAQQLFFDHWDEGQLTLFANQLGKAPMYVGNCYGIHMAYGCTQKQREIEMHYLTNLFSTL